MAYMTKKLNSLSVTCPRALRVAISLQINEKTPPDIPLDLDSVLLPLLPDGGVDAMQEYEPTTSTSRANIPPAQISALFDSGTATANDGAFDPAPPATVSRIEYILWPQLGRASTFAARFLYGWITEKKFMRACELANCESTNAGLWRNSSPIYNMLHGAGENAIRTARFIRSESTLHQLGNGDIEKIRETYTQTGDIIKLSDGPIYSEKALALELQANDRARYGTNQPAVQAQGIQINVSVVAPRHNAPPVVKTSEALLSDKEAIEAEWIEA